MPNFTGYFATTQMANNPQGVWFISHPERNNHYFRIYLNALQRTTPIYDFDAPGLPPKTYMTAVYGMTWYEMRTIMRFLFTSPARDQMIIENVKQRVQHLIPVRTGHLMNEIFKTMAIARYQYGSSQFFAQFTYNYPGDRPGFIRNPKHTPPDEGYGDWGTVKLTEPIAISRVNWIYITGGGNALYVLNDPEALSSIVPMIAIAGLYEIEDDYATVFNEVIITAMI